MVADGETMTKPWVRSKQGNIDMKDVSEHEKKYWEAITFADEGCDR